MLIFPIILIGFMSNVIGRASASLKRISVVLNAPETKKNGTRKTSIRGEIEARDVSLEIDGHAILKHVSFSFKAGKKTAILGPTAAGKTQLLYLLTGLLPPTSGDILFDGYPLEAYDQESFHEQVGFVFQDSVLFNLSLRENIAFHEKVTEASLKKAISTAELDGFIETLPNGLETLVSERGTSLSGGQKQRIMLARALALDPSVLILDDFTARVDAETEHRILRNLDQNYPHLTLISVTQKIVSVESYDHLCVLMEGDVIAQGTHAELVKRSPEYMQILESQRSTTLYEDSRS
jgi:ATP-binding cassette subfamily B protein